MNKYAPLRFTYTGKILHPGVWMELSHATGSLGST
jgi:hypothetical protein